MGSAVCMYLANTVIRESPHLGVCGIMYLANTVIRESPRWGVYGMYVSSKYSNQGEPSLGGLRYVCI